MMVMLMVMEEVLVMAVVMVMMIVDSMLRSAISSGCHGVFPSWLHFLYFSGVPLSPAVHEATPDCANLLIPIECTFRLRRA